MWRYIADEENLNISYSTKKAPIQNGVFLRTLKKEILGKSYDLNIYFVGAKMMRKVNRTYRKKDYATDTLSFPYLEDNFGEIYMCMEKVASKAKKFETTTEKYLDYLFVHSMIHLTGLDHGDEMDTFEQKITKKLNIFYPY